MVIENSMQTHSMISILVRIFCTFYVGTNVDYFNRYALICYAHYSTTAGIIGQTNQIHRHTMLAFSHHIFYPSQIDFYQF